MSNLLNKVVVTTVKNGKTGVESFIHSGKEGFASVFVTCVKTSTVVNENTGSTFVQKSSRSAWINGEEDFLKSIYTHNGQVIEGQIVRLYSFEPFYNGQQPVINPQTNQVVLKDGKTFYFKDVYDQSGLLKDKWVTKTPPQPQEEISDFA